jgi:hypothetical protein
MPRKRSTRLYTRTQGGQKRFYADLRDYSDVGGRREALIAPDEKLATDDQNVAEVLLGRRIEELDAKRRGRAIHGIVKQATLSEFALEHLIATKRAGAVTDEWIAAAQLYLQRALDYFGTDRELSTITVAEVRQWMAHLQTLSNRRGGTLTGWSARHHLNQLSKLYRRAASEGYVAPGSIRLLHFWRNRARQSMRRDGLRFRRRPYFSKQPVHTSRSVVTWPCRLHTNSSRRFC